MIKIQKILFVIYFLVNIVFNWPHGSSHLLESYGISRNNLDISIYNLQSFMRENEIITRPPNFNKENSGSFGQETVDLFWGNFNKIQECGTEKIHYLDGLRKLNLEDKDDLTELKWCLKDLVTHYQHPPDFPVTLQITNGDTTPFDWLKELELVSISADNLVTFNDEVSLVIGNWYTIQDNLSVIRENTENYRSFISDLLVELPESSKETFIGMMSESQIDKSLIQMESWVNIIAQFDSIV